MAASGVGPEGGGERARTRRGEASAATGSARTQGRALCPRSGAGSGWHAARGRPARAAERVRLTAWPNAAYAGERASVWLRGRWASGRPGPQPGGLLPRRGSLPPSPALPLACAHGGSCHGGLRAPSRGPASRRLCPRAPEVFLRHGPAPMAGLMNRFHTPAITSGEGV